MKVNVPGVDDPAPIFGLHSIRQIAHEKQSLGFAPSAVYRLQLNKNFTFRHALSVIPYLKELGVDAVYLSPIFQAVPGSIHGYNVTDPNKINPELGGEQDFQELCDALKAAGLGLILDVVPNHMGIGANNNPWWNDVLENGPGSRYAHFFDIDWEPAKKELKDKVLIPVLGDQYGVVLEERGIELCFSEGAFSIACGDRRFPLAPDTYYLILEYGLDHVKAQFKESDRDLLEYLSILAALRNLPQRTERSKEKIEERHREKEIAKERLAKLVEVCPLIVDFIEDRIRIFNGVKKNSRSFDLLDGLLQLQSYRLSYWRVASEEINYRRFFDINEFAAIRMEDPEVFDVYHKLIFEWLEKGKIQGLRIDHPDGLYDPVAYFRKLQQKFLFYQVRDEWARQNGPPTPEAAEGIQQVVQEESFLSAAPLYLIVEKILDRKEYLPQNWAVHGTVGYDFLNALTGLFVAQKNENAFTDIYKNFSGGGRDFEALFYEKRKFFAAFYTASEVNMLAHRLDTISEKIRRYRDFTLSNLTTAIREVMACFPVYRTYIRPGETVISERDQKYIHIAITRAKRKHPTLNPAVFDFLKQVLLGALEEAFSDEEKKLFREFVLRFQQLTAPIMAKGLEDTVFYIYNRFISLNEVGGDPIHFGYSADEFHRQNQMIQGKWPYSFIASSTHDTKRSEDVRFRLNVLSEMPEQWARKVNLWHRLNEPHQTLAAQGTVYPDRNTEYFLYQTLAGVWPHEEAREEEISGLRERLWEYFLKAVREAKAFTNWINPNEEYEGAVKKFIFALLSPQNGDGFLKDFRPFQKMISGYGMWNALSGILLKIASPGVNDYYQGASEAWDYSLVDPDNRRPVDFELRKSLLFKIKDSDSFSPSQEMEIREILRNKADGRIKTFLLWKGLNFRRRNREIFLEGDYQPLCVEGGRAHNAVVFSRRKGNRIVLVVCARFFTELIEDPQKLPLGKEIWQDSAIVLPEDMDFERTQTFTDCFTQKRISWIQRNESRVLPLSEVFGSLSVALLENS